MSTTVFAIKRGDRLPSPLVPITNTDGTPVDLTSATSIVFQMRSGAGATPKVNAAAVVVNPPTAGLVRYDFAAGDTDTVGDYLAAVVVTFPGTLPQTFPGDGLLLVRIEPAVTDVPVYGATFPPAYAGLPSLKAYPSYQDLSRVVPGADAAHQDAELTNLLVRASAAMDGLMNRSYLPKTSTRSERVRVNSDYEAQLIPLDRPFNRITALSATPVPGSPPITMTPAQVYPEYAGTVPILHVPMATSGVGPGSSVLLTYTLETGCPATVLSADAAAAATQVTVRDPRGLAAGGPLRLLDPGTEEYLTVAATYIAGSTTVPLAAPLTFAHKAGAFLSGLPADLEEACILWALGLLPRGATEDEFADAPVTPTATGRSSRRGGSGFIAQAKKILCDGGYSRVYS